MATTHVEIPDEVAEALRVAEVPPGAVVADATALDGVLRWSIQHAAHEVAAASEEADRIDVERIRSLASRIEQLAWVYERMEVR